MRSSILSLLVVITSAMIITSCNGKQQNAAQAAVEVPVETVQKGDGEIAKHYPASIEGVVTIEVRAQVSGYLNKIHVDEGDMVKAGQVLFTIDSRSYSEQYNNANAAVQVAKASLANAKIELGRRKELVNNKIVSDLQVQQAQASYDGAAAALAQAQAAAQSAKINLDYCTIKAPVNGYIGRIQYRLGSLIGATNALPLTVLSDVHNINAYFSMSENDFIDFQNTHKGTSIQEKIRGAAPVKLQLSDGSYYKLDGKIDAIDGQFDKSTGSVSCRAVFSNPNGVLRDGNTGKIVIAKAFHDALLLPIVSTFTIQDKVYVYSIKDGKMVQIPLEIDGKSGNNYIVTSGIAPGDSYIVSGFERLQPGTPVTAVKNKVIGQK